MGDYFREIFFHAPFLVANALSADRRFDQTQQWLQYIFNPTAPPQPSLARPTDRVWNYLPFRNLAADDMGRMTSGADRGLQQFAVRSRRHHGAASGGLRQGHRDALHFQHAGWGNQLFREFTPRP